MDGTLVALGYVSRAHGVRGELRLERFVEDSTALGSARRLFLRPRGGGAARTFEVVSSRPEKKAILARFRGIDTREAAEALRGLEVCVPRSELPEAGEGEVYLFDLVGLEVKDGERSVGRVEAAVHHPAADCVVVRTATGTIEIPISEPYVVEVDLRDRVLRVAHTEDFEPEVAP